MLAPSHHAARAHGALRMARIDPLRWKRQSALLDELLELGAAARAARLEQVQDHDRELADELRTLLAGDASLDRDGFLAGDVCSLLDHAVTAGQTLGAYTLDRPLGTGGMGAVWLAHRSDGRYAGTVAIKLLTPALMAGSGALRFAQEGRALARLGHPNIARLHDAGVTPAGQPYLVLEHVRGVHIDQWCESRRLGVHARVRVVLDVLAAVAHAHSKLVLHRDLKPSNILITDEGQVKLLDFGVAKLLDDDGGPIDSSQITQIGARAFTPDYAAPEQIDGGEVSTATDVYALGVLMYVLLGGGHPTARPTDSPAERLRSVVTTEPQRLSTAAVRNAGSMSECWENGARLNRALRGDLDNIVAKALKKAPGERYATVAALADDLQRHLTNQPVSAHADTLGYRAAKFMRRHRAGVLTTGIVGAALVASSAAALLQTVEARQQRQVAEEEATRASSTREFLEFVLTDAGASGRPFTTDELLARGERQFAVQFGRSESRLAVEQLTTLAKLYSALGRQKKALELTGIAHRRATDGGYADLRRQVACELAQQLHFASRLDDAARLLDRSIAELRAGKAAAPALIECLQYRSDLSLTQDDIGAGVAAAEESTALAATLLAAAPTAQVAPRMQLAVAYRLAGQREKANGVYQELDLLLKQLGRDRTADAAVLDAGWALVKSDVGDALGATHLLEAALDISRAMRPDGKPDHITSLNYGQRLLTLGRLDDARRFFERAQVMARGEDDADISALALLGLAAVQRERGDLAAAEAALGVTRRFVDERFPAEHPARTELLLEAGRLRLAHRDFGAAAEALSTVVGRNAAVKARRPSHALNLALLALAEAHGGDAELALVHAQRASALAGDFALPGRTSYWIGHCLLLQAEVERLRGNADSSRALAARAASQLAATVGAGHPLTSAAQALSHT
jgi:serine/threonine protein kinase/tetratricopeptide (TPR) repeat protein